MRKLKRWAFASGAVQNMRDLGGYVCDGGMTKYGVVLRSDQLHGLAQDEIELLKACGLTDVIDLRSEGERNQVVNDFLNDDQVTVHACETGHNVDAKQFDPTLFDNMGDMYLAMVDVNGNAYVDMVRIVARAKGMCIVHCMAGKDRTGIICSLILSALGVEEGDIVADYQISEVHNMRNVMLVKFISESPEHIRYLARSQSENMFKLLAHWNEKYGGALNYLKRHGFTDEDLNALKARMVTAIED